MKKSIVTVAILAFFALTIVQVFAANSCCTSKPNTEAVKQAVSAVCPVTGSKIADVSKAAAKTTYKGNTYYFCCAACEKSFTKDPEKFLKANAKAKPSGICTMAGEKVCCQNPADCKCSKNSCMVNGKCANCDAKCDGCPAVAAKKQVKCVDSVVCPVTGNKIPDVSKAADKSEYKGKAYYFCCGECKAEFDKNPEKYIKK